MKSYNEAIELIAQYLYKAEVSKSYAIAEMYNDDAIGMCKMVGFMFDKSYTSIRREAWAITREMLKA